MTNCKGPPSPFMGTLDYIFSGGAAVSGAVAATSSTLEAISVRSGGLCPACCCHAARVVCPLEYRGGDLGQGGSAAPGVVVRLLLTSDAAAALPCWLLQVLELPQLDNGGYLPSAVYPSDHMPLAAKFRLNPPPDSAAAAAAATSGVPATATDLSLGEEGTMRTV